MKKLLSAIIALTLLQGCVNLELKPDSPHGVAVFSTSLVDGCDGFYFDNSTLFFENRPDASVDFNIPVGHVGSGIGSIVKNAFHGSDFGDTGKVHVWQLAAGKYYFTKMHATPIAFVHRETEQLNISFEVDPGKVNYVGALELGSMNCSDPGGKANVGYSTIANIKNEKDRDMKYAQEKWESIPLDLVDEKLATHKKK